MKTIESIGMLLLGIWLILFGLLVITGIKIPINLIYLLAIITGILLLVSKARISGSIGVILLGIWLVLKGLLPFINIEIPQVSIILSLLAICTGIFIILKR